MPIRVRPIWVHGASVGHILSHRVWRRLAAASYA